MTDCLCLLFYSLFFYSFIIVIIMSIAEWDNEYARLARAASQMRTTGLVTQQGDVQALLQGLQRLEQALDALPLQPAEIQRRKRLITHLQQTSTGGAASGSGGGGSVSGGSVTSGMGSANVPVSSQMQLAMRQQDELIDELAVGVGRLKNQTITIGDEAKMHVNLLHDMEQNLDLAHEGLEGETRRAARLREDQSVWRLQLIVAGLFILLILLILMGFS